MIAAEHAYARLYSIDRKMGNKLHAGMDGRDPVFPVPRLKVYRMQL